LLYHGGEFLLILIGLLIGRILAALNYFHTF
jgi:hypothetical protein